MVTRGEVRFAVLGLAQRIRLEVLPETGDPVFDSDFRRGGVVEWVVQNEHGSVVPDGIYGCLITVESLEGEVSQRKGIFRVQGGRAAAEGSRPSRSAAAEDAQDEFAVLQSTDAAPLTLMSHDGNEGWVESVSGGLSFYARSMSRTRDSVPHLRLTPDGNLGIGVAEPSAKLDVAGVIRASEGFQFSDGTVLKMEGGWPVLVTEAASHSSKGKTGTAGTIGGMAGGMAGTRTIRVLAAGGVVTPRFGNETGSNTWYGESAGANITIGSVNSFVGQSAGFSNTIGYCNAFFGAYSGYNNDMGSVNSFVGATAGYNNTTGTSNSFFGTGAGYFNTTGDSNSFVGQGAGQPNTTDNDNSFFGSSSGTSNTTENNNSFFGAYSDGAAGITNATALGYRAKVTQSNSLVLGSINGVNSVNADTKVGIGITAPERRFHVAETATSAVRGVSFDQYSADPFASVFVLRKSRNATPGGHTILQSGDALFNFTGQGSDGAKFVDVARIRMEIDGTPGVNDMPGRMTFWTTPDGAAAPSEQMRIDSNGNVGIGTTAPAERLHVNGNIRASCSITAFASPETEIPDYVFEPGYKLMPLDEVGRFVEREKHLPNVPPAAEIRKNGLNLADFQMKLLEKIEELTLHAVKQAKAIDQKDAEIGTLKAEAADQRKQNAALDARLAALEQAMAEIVGDRAQKQR